MYERLLQKVNTNNLFAADLLAQLSANFRKLIVALVALYWVYPFMDSLLFPNERGWQLWQVAFLLSLGSIICFVLVKRSFILALTVYEIILFSIISLNLLVTANTSMIWLYMTLPPLAFLLSGWRMGVLSLIGLGVGLLWFQSMATPSLLSFTTINWLLVLSTLIGGAITIVLGPLFEFLDWAATNYQSTQHDLGEARQDRALVRRTLNTVNHSVRSLERANTELIVSQQSAEEAERFKTQFVRHLSHEFRTPLNLILGFTDVMIHSPESYRSPLPPPYRSDMRALHRSALHLLELVNEVLDLARIETGNVSIEPKLIQVKSIISDVGTMMRKHIESKGIAFNVSCESNLQTAYLDPIRIRQVLLNLLSNAVRFTDRGSINLSVTVEGEYLKFEVSDTGKGISKNDLERIFQPFRTKDNGNRWYHGTGLGLSITKQLIELHGGEINVQSTISEGTTFSFTIPLHPSSATASSATYLPLLQIRKASHFNRRVIVVYHESLYLVSFLKSSLNHYDVVQAKSWEDTVRLAIDLRAIAVISCMEDVRNTLPDSVLLITFPFPADEQYYEHQQIGGVLVKPFSRTELQLLLDQSAHPINRILVADDDPDIVRLIRRMLHGEFLTHDILSAHNGLEALEMIAVHKPDIVFLDMLMPELDGQGVLEILAANHSYPRTSVIIMSATHNRLEDVPVDGLLHLQVRHSSPMYELVALIHQTLSAWV